MKRLLNLCFMGQFTDDDKADIVYFSSASGANPVKTVQVGESFVAW